MAQPGKLPILRAAQYSWSFTMAAFVPTLPAYLIRALVTGASFAAMASSLNGGALPLDMISSILGLLITISCLAMTLRFAMKGEMSGKIGLEFGASEGRLFLAHAIYWVLLFFLGFIALFVVFVILTPILAMLLPDLESAAQDPEAFQQIAEEFARSSQGVMFSLLVVALVSVPLLYLTARLIAFPAATIARDRVMIFDTWSWTKGNVLPVILAMIVALLPLWVLSSAGAWIASILTGFPLLLPFAGTGAIEQIPNPVMAFVFGLIASVFSIPMQLAYAGLSAFMYQGFNPDGKSA